MSNTATPRLKAFARRLLAYDLASGKDSTAFGVCEKLRGPLGKLVGVGGFRSLLSRALALGGADIHWLRALHVRADGSLEGLEKLEAKLDVRAVAEAEVVLVAELLGLLVTFIGPELTRGLLRDIWPKLNDLDF